MPHWIQCEFAPSGKNTGAMQIDLEQVKRIHIKRESKEIAGCVIKYADEPGFSVDAVVAEQFLKCWAEYQEQQGGLKFVAPDAEPGLLTIATGKQKVDILSAR